MAYNVLIVREVSLTQSLVCAFLAHKNLEGSKGHVL